jgi:prephenate dehydrogenase
LVRDSPAWPELASLASSGFRDVTRLASTDPDLSHDICLTNRESLLHWLDRITEELGRYRELLKEGQEKPLFEGFAKAQLDRDTFVTAGPPRREPTLEPVSSGEQLAALLVGHRLVKRVKDIGKLLEERQQESRRKKYEDRGRP